MRALERNKTWEFLVSPYEKEGEGLNLIYKIKYQAGGYVQKYKARLVTHGYMQ